MASIVLGQGWSIGDLFLLVAVLNAGVAVFIYTQAPEFVLRFCAWVLVHTLYRIKVRGRANIPDSGPALLVCNHVSYVDALVIGGLIGRPVLFVLYYNNFESQLLRWLFSIAGVVPIASAKENPDMLAAAYERIDQLLVRGEVACIFPEGRLTSSGAMSAFKPGVEKILNRRPVPVVPMALSGLWGSFFSRKPGLLRHIPKPLVHRVTLSVGAAVAPGDADAAMLEARVAELAAASD